jgi:ubiquinone/menaquinone biosynthesis C-methylase UbiE
MRMFLRKPARATEPLAVTMSGVRMGERVLQIGIDDAALTGALAAKTGLSGQASIAVASEAEADRARRAAADAAALADVVVTPLQALPFESDQFDAIVVHGSTQLAAPGEGTHLSVASECRRVLRHGGRILVIERESRGLGGLLRPRDGSRPADGDNAAIGALTSAGFTAVRQLAVRGRLRFVEGLKG